MTRMPRKEYLNNNEFLKRVGMELDPIMKMIEKHGLDVVKKHGFFYDDGGPIPENEVKPTDFGPRLKALLEGEGADAARDIACYAAALRGGYNPKMVAVVFSNDGDGGKTNFLADLLGGAREIHEKTEKGVKWPFFPFFDHRNGESLIGALSKEERKLLGVGEFEPAQAPSSGAVEDLLKFIGERSTGRRTPAQVFFSYYSREEREEKEEKRQITAAVSVADGLALNERPTGSAVTTLEDLAPPSPPPTPPAVKTVRRLGDPIPEVEVVKTATVIPEKIPEKPAARAGNGQAEAGNGKASNGQATEISELVSQLVGNGSVPSLKLAVELKKGKISLTDAKKHAVEKNLL